MPRQGPVERPADGPVRASDGEQAPRRREIDLGLALDRTVAAPLTDQLEQLLRGQIRQGQLRGGAALPSSRALAAALGVSRGVVVEAYDRLRHQGLVVARQGGAVTVAPAASLAPGGGGQPPVAGPRAVEGATALQPPRLRFHPALLPPGSFDRRAWAAAERRALARATDDELRSVSQDGLPRLRRALAAQLARSRGVACGAHEVSVTSGTSHTLAALAPLLRGRGPLAVEQPGFLLHHGALAAAGVQLRPTPVGPGGIDVDALHASDAQTVLVTAAHQMPLGAPMSAEVRGRLLAWAQQRGALILEDDYDGELRYDRRSVRALQALDPARVLYLGTTSKVLTPAVRAGWIIAPGELREQIAMHTMLAGGGPGNLVQLALAELIAAGDFDRASARLRRRLAVQRAALLAELADAAPQLEPLGVPAGLMVALRAHGLTAQAVMAAARDAGVELHAFDEPGESALLLAGFGDIHESRAGEAAAAIAAITGAASAPKETDTDDVSP